MMMRILYAASRMERYEIHIQHDNNNYIVYKAKAKWIWVNWMSVECIPTNVMFFDVTNVIFVMT